MDFEFHAITRAFPFLLDGLGTTFKLTALAAGFGLLWGSVLAIARFSPSRTLSLAATAYVNGVRAVPLIMVIFWIYFLLPLLTGRQIGAFNSALVAFVVFEGAYFSEIMRAGIQSVPRGQLQAAQSMGMGYVQGMRLVVLPQAVRKMMPVLLTQGIALFQDTSLVYVIGLMDLLNAAATVGTRDGRLVELYTFVAAVYLVLCLVAAGAVELLRRRFIPN